MRAYVVSTTVFSPRLTMKPGVSSLSAVAVIVCVKVTRSPGSTRMSRPCGLVKSTVEARG